MGDGVSGVLFGCVENLGIEWCEQIIDWLDDAGGGGGAMDNAPVMMGWGSHGVIEADLPKPGLMGLSSDDHDDALMR